MMLSSHLFACCLPEPVWKGSVICAKEDGDQIRWGVPLCEDLLQKVRCPPCVISAVPPGNDICLYQQLSVDNRKTSPFGIAQLACRGANVLPHAVLALWAELRYEKSPIVTLR